MSKKRKNKNRAKRKTGNAVQKAVQAAKRPQPDSSHTDNPESSEAHSEPLSTDDSAVKSVLYSVRVDAALRDQFNACCREQDTSGSQVLRRYMRSFISKYAGQ